MKRLILEALLSFKGADDMSIERLIIENPIVLPDEGMLFTCKWSDFMPKEDVEIINKCNDNLAGFYVARSWIEYFKDKTVFTITLVSDEDYEEYYAKVKIV